MQTEATEMSVQELEALLAKKKDAQKKQREKERKTYEAERDKKIDELMKEALELSQRLSEFKAKCHSVMDDQGAKLDAYGAIRGNSKGGFSVTHSNGEMRIVRRRDTAPYWDERANKGVQMIKEFLHEIVKKRDQKLFELLISFLERNKEGDLEFARVMTLIKHEDKFDDTRWIEGLRLIKESYMSCLKSFGYEFKMLAGDGKWTNLTLNFSAL